MGLSHALMHPTPVESQERRIVVKKIALLIVIAFGAYYLLTSPGSAADSVRGAVDAVMSAFGQIRVFFERLVG